MQTQDDILTYKYGDFPGQLLNAIGLARTDLIVGSKNKKREILKFFDLWLMLGV